MLFFFKKLNFLIFNVLREKAEAFFFFFLFFSFQKELLRQRIKGLCTNELKSWIFGCVKTRELSRCPKPIFEFIMHMPLFRLFVPFFLFLSFSLAGRVELGVDRLFREEGFRALLKGKRVGLITNQTGVDSELKATVELFLQKEPFRLFALFAPEHGIDGKGYAAEKIPDLRDFKGVPLYSLHGKTRRPTEKMLQGIDVLVFDIQDVGVRSYTYLTTLCYVMEEAAGRGIPVVVLDRPNPLGGELVDGPMLEERWRSFVSYLNVPYCHGMTLGELALFFNEKSRVGCDLTVVPMRGWKRKMSFLETGLHWIPTSPQIPEATTPFFAAATGILGELGLVSIGVGYTLPFKVVGAPWIDADGFALALSSQNLPGVAFIPCHFRPFFGAYKGEDCHGVRIYMTDRRAFRPLSVQYLLIGMLKSLYPKEVDKRLKALSQGKRDLFCKVNGNEEMWKWLREEKYSAWKMIGFQQEERKAFCKLRKPFLLYD